MKTLTISTIGFMLLSATSVLHANGMMGGASTTTTSTTTKTSGTGPSKTSGMGSTKPTGGKPGKTASCAATDSRGRTNCHGFSGPQINPGMDYTRWRPGYIGGPEVMKGVKQNGIPVAPGRYVNTSGYTIPHLGTVPGTAKPDHSYVIYPGGGVAQRFDMNTSGYAQTFPNLDAFRNQEFPIGSGRYPFANATFVIHCPTRCTQAH